MNHYRHVKNLMDSNKHQRRSIRLKEYDYSQPNWYFITISTKDRNCLFGDITENVFSLNQGGKIAHECWNNIPSHYPNVELDNFIIMPNHVHGIIVINESPVGVHNFEPLQYGYIKRNCEPANKYQQIIKCSIGSIIRGFKIGVTKWFRNNTSVYDVWQRNYYEHIIRNENELNQICQYIEFNPFNWLDDEYY